MLVRLTHEQITKFWNVLKDALEKCMPPVAEGESELKLNNLLRAFLTNDALQCWVWKDEQPRFILVTTVSEDVSGVRSLLIYALYGLETLKRGDIENCYRVLSAYANSRQCSTISGYTNVRSIAELVKGISGSKVHAFFTVPILE